MTDPLKELTVGGLVANMSSHLWKKVRVELVFNKDEPLKILLEVDGEVLTDCVSRTEMRMTMCAEEGAVSVAVKRLLENMKQHSLILDRNCP